MAWKAAYLLSLHKEGNTCAISNHQVISKSSQDVSLKGIPSFFLVNMDSSLVTCHTISVLRMLVCAGQHCAALFADALLAFDVVSVSLFWFYET